MRDPMVPLLVGFYDNAGTLTPAGCTDEGMLATIDSTLVVTSILEAGRISLDNGGASVEITYDAAGIEPVELKMGGASSAGSPKKRKLDRCGNI